MRAIGILVLIALPALASGYRPSEDIISDPVTGAAIFGYDPVAYHVEGRAVEGSMAFSIGHAGKSWQFASEANRAAFMQNPETYLPAFGGHDPVAIASGIALGGSPALFVIHDTRIYLFREARNRDAFLANPAIREEAERHWPEVRRLLSP